MRVLKGGRDEEAIAPPSQSGFNFKVCNPQVFDASTTISLNN